MKRVLGDDRYQQHVKEISLLNGNKCREIGQNLKPITDNGDVSVNNSLVGRSGTKPPKQTSFTEDWQFNTDRDRLICKSTLVIYMYVAYEVESRLSQSLKK